MQMVIRVVGNPSFVIFQDRRFGYGEDSGSEFPANRTVSSTFCSRSHPETQECSLEVDSISLGTSPKLE